MIIFLLILFTIPTCYPEGTVIPCPKDFYRNEDTVCKPCKDICKEINGAGSQIIERCKDICGIISSPRTRNYTIQTTMFARDSNKDVALKGAHIAIIIVIILVIVLVSIVVGVLVRRLMCPSDTRSRTRDQVVYTPVREAPTAPPSSNTAGQGQDQQPTEQEAPTTPSSGTTGQGQDQQPTEQAPTAPSAGTTTGQVQGQQPTKKEAPTAPSSRTTAGQVQGQQPTKKAPTAPSSGTTAGQGQGQQETEKDPIPETDHDTQPSLESR